jgi:hypothetical protein
MNEQLSQWVGLSIETKKDHEWDAVVSCFAVYEGLLKRWKNDLHQQTSIDDKMLIYIGKRSINPIFTGC